MSEMIPRIYTTRKVENQLQVEILKRSGKEAGGCRHQEQGKDQIFNAPMQKVLQMNVEYYKNVCSRALSSHDN